MWRETNFLRAIEEACWEIGEPLVGASQRPERADVGVVLFEGFHTKANTPTMQVG